MLFIAAILWLLRHFGCCSKRYISRSLYSISCLFRMCLYRRKTDGVILSYQLVCLFITFEFKDFIIFSLNFFNRLDKKNVILKIVTLYYRSIETTVYCTITMTVGYNLCFILSLLLFSFKPVTSTEYNLVCWLGLRNVNTYWVIFFTNPSFSKELYGLKYSYLILIINAELNGICTTRRLS